MKKLIYNQPSKERATTKRLTLEESVKVIEVINRLRFGDVATKNENELIQRFIWNYENLEHHASSLEGFFAVENEDDVIDPMNKLFKIEF